MTPFYYRIPLGIIGKSHPDIYSQNLCKGFPDTTGEFRPSIWQNRSRYSKIGYYMLIQTFTNSLCCMILNWYSHNVSGICIHYRDYKSFCLIVIWKGAHYVNTDNIPWLRAFNRAFGKVPLFIIFSQLAFRACANYLTALFPPFGCNKFPVKGLPGLVFAKMTLPVDFLCYFFCLLLLYLYLTF